MIASEYHDAIQESIPILPSFSSDAKSMKEERKEGEKRGRIESEKRMMREKHRGGTMNTRVT